MSPNLAEFFFALFFFAVDERNDVVNHFGPCGEILSGAGNGLIRTGQRTFDAQIQQRMNGRDIGLQRAVGFDGNKAGFRAKAFPLCVNDFRVVCIDFRDDHRNIRRETVRGVGGHNRASEFGIGFFQGFDFIFFHVDCAEDEINRRRDCFHVGNGVMHNEFGKLFRHR